jgi:3-isopropylmalate dehydrogenase
MTRPTLLLMPGDGIGPEIFGAMAPLFDWVGTLGIEMASIDVGYAAYRAHGDTLTHAALAAAATADAILFGSESTEEYLHLPKADRPQSGLLRLRQHLNGYASLRPVRTFASLPDASPLKPEVVRDVDLVIVRELLGGMYFGRPQGMETLADGRRRAVDTMVYDSDEIERIAITGFELARTRRKKLCSVDKANVLATSSLWREIVIDIAARYPDVAVDHLYVDACAMELIRRPRDFDVILTENTFGDILSDGAAVLGGSIGMLPSATIGTGDLGSPARGLYEPVSGSAPDIAGRNIANPIGTILSLAMALRFSFGQADSAAALEAAVEAALAAGARTRDIGGDLGTVDMVRAIERQLSSASAVAA